MSVDYKYKPDKHKFRVNVKTIDEIHKEQIEEFKKNKEEIPEKKEKLRILNQELRILEEVNKGKPINLDFELLKKRNNLKRQIKDLSDDISKIESCSKEMDYFSRTGDVVYDYYDLTNGILYAKNYDENTDDDKNDNMNEKDKKNDNPVKGLKIEISDELLAITNLNRKRKLKKPVRKRTKKIETTESKSIMSYLLGSDNEKEDEKDNEKDQTLCKATLQNEYLLMMDKEYACTKTKTSLIRKCKKSY